MAEKKKQDEGRNPSGGEAPEGDGTAVSPRPETREKIYEIPSEGESNLQAALKELEEHADAVEKRRRLSRKKGKKKDDAAAEAQIECDKLRELNSELSEEVKSLKDKWLRSVAEFENYRKRSRKEWELLKMQTKAEVILEFLNAVDDFERALSVASDRDDDFIQGIRLIYQNMVQSLEKSGVRPITTLNSRFDPAFHMAIAQIESDSVASGHVVEETQKGYMIDDTVLRPAKVIIAK